jgi:hypothetical protein
MYTTRISFTYQVKEMRGTAMPFPSGDISTLQRKDMTLSIEVEANKIRPGHGELSVIVLAPREPDPKTFEFRRTETVRDSARTAADTFGYEGGNPSFETEQHVVLDRDKTLAEAGVHDGERLHLVDVGGGV